MILGINFNVVDGLIEVSDSATTGTWTGSVVITHPDGFVNTVNLSNAATSGSVALREDSDDNVLLGVYGFVYTNTEDVSESVNIDYQYAAPTVKIDCKVDYLCSKLVSTDVTSYALPTVSAANTSVTRTHKVFYPAATGLDAIEASAQIINVNPIYTGTFTLLISSEVVWTFATHTISDTLTGDVECVVDENNQLCTLVCCMKEAYKRWDAARCANARTAADLELAFRRVTSLATLAYVSLSCGKGDITEYVNEALKVAGCKDCDCGGEVGKQVVGLCGASSTGEVDVVAGTGITITAGGVVNVDTVWLTNFVNNIIAALDLAALQGQVDANTDAVETAQEGVDAAFTQLNTINTLLTNVSTRFTNHNILSFSYRFRWLSNTLTDNRDGSGFVTDAFVQKMNGTGVAGWLANPKVTWVNAATSNAPAEFEVELLGTEGASVLTVFNNLNVVCTLVGRGSTATGALARVKPVVFNIGTGGENTLLRFRVRFWSESFGYVSQSFVSANTANIGGDIHLSFFVTGKN